MFPQQWWFAFFLEISYPPPLTSQTRPEFCRRTQPPWGRKLFPGRLRVPLQVCCIITRVSLQLEKNFSINPRKTIDIYKVFFEPKWSTTYNVSPFHRTLTFAPPPPWQLVFLNSSREAHEFGILFLEGGGLSCKAASLWAFLVRLLLPGLCCLVRTTELRKGFTPPPPLMEFVEYYYTPPPPDFLDMYKERPRTPQAPNPILQVCLPRNGE